MAWEELEEKKAMRIINIIIEIVIACISVVLAIALWLTVDFTLYYYSMMELMFPFTPGLQNLLIAILIAQIAGGISIVVRSVSRIWKTLMKEGRP